LLILAEICSISAETETELQTPVGPEF